MLELEQRCVSNPVVSIVCLHIYDGGPLRRPWTNEFQLGRRTSEGNGPSSLGPKGPALIARAGPIRLLKDEAVTFQPP